MFHKNRTQETTENGSSEGCVPGESFKKDCNYCTCSPDGKTAACTLMSCTGDEAGSLKRALSSSDWLVRRLRSGDGHGPGPVIPPEVRDLIWDVPQEGAVMLGSQLMMRLICDLDITTEDGDQPELVRRK
ncbi:hypothetical protein AAG570_011194 [Ranatra chinensis]|uniref:Pacifastin domain-containing protein n=1 Tax=Ranatra chinensis TaxID=642074 RepID=A0ABD0YJZ6_9HEMI